MGPMRACSRADAESRLAQAEVFALHAEVDPLTQDGAGRSVAVSNAILAGIAASDSICCRTLGLRSNKAHKDASMVLKKVPGLGNEAALHLSTLLAIKPKAQYSPRHPTPSETKKSMRAMRKLLQVAQQFRESDP